MSTDDIESKDQEKKEEERERPHLPSPEEIQAEFENFVKERFGSHIQIKTERIDWEDQERPGEKKQILRPAADQKEATDEEELKERPLSAKDLKFDYLPHEVKKHLDQYVIGQDEAKKAVSVALCDHYNYVKDCLSNPEITKEDYGKQNVLILGPTGVGKTYLIKKVAQLMGVPFVKADATRFSETGYVGANVEDLVKDLVTQANGNIELAQYGIIYLDEADKLATPPNVAGRDVTGRGVQMGLLKLMEETDVNLKSGHDVSTQIQSLMEFQQTGKVKKKIINTRHILFIVSGAFSGLGQIIKKRLNLTSVGLKVVEKQKNQELADEDCFSLVNSDDLQKFGFEPEFIGRLPIKASCHHLDEKDLYHILKDSKGSLINQYQRAFRSYGIEVNFKDEALKTVARLAMEEKTGARGLMTVLEKVFRHFKFYLPATPIRNLIVDPAMIENPQEALKNILGEDYPHE